MIDEASIATEGLVAGEVHETSLLQDIGLKGVGYMGIIAGNTYLAMTGDIPTLDESIGLEVVNNPLVRASAILGLVRYGMKLGFRLGRDTLVDRGWIDSRKED
ncbi:MAG: hypothetical protein QG623_461 [Patescibacteria group bacterium]|nr:hypothetical protein [Patescibacteria group bacterium]